MDADRKQLAVLQADWRAFKARAWTALAATTWIAGGLYATALWVAG